MTIREKNLCRGIIHSASATVGAVGAGLAQVPGSDNLVITPIQLTMAISLGKVFGITLDRSERGESGGIQRCGSNSRSDTFTGFVRMVPMRGKYY